MGRTRSTTVRVRWVAAENAFGIFWKEPGPGGKLQKRAKFRPTETEAQMFAEEQQCRIDIAESKRPPAPSTVSSNGGVTYRVFRDGWLTNHVERKKPSTRRSYEDITDMHVVDQTITLPDGDTAVFGDLPVPDIKRAHVAAVINARRRAGVSWGTQKVVIRVVSTSLTYAVDQGLLQANPTARLAMSLKDSNAPDASGEPAPNPLSRDQFEAFLSWLRTGRAPAREARTVDGVLIPARTSVEVDGPALRGWTLRSQGYPEWVPYFEGLGRTGMRVGEAAALRTDDIKFDRLAADGTPEPRAILRWNFSPSALALGVETQVAEGRKWRKLPPGEVTLKNGKERPVDLSAALVLTWRAMLKARREATMREGRKLSPYFFLGRFGGRIRSDDSTAERIFHKGMAAIGAAHEEHTQHDLRDTFATMHLIEGGVGKLAWVSWMLGHGSVAVTLKRYTRWLDQFSGGHANASSCDPKPVEAPAAATEKTGPRLVKTGRS